MNKKIPYLGMAVVFMFFFTHTVWADELSELKEQLRIVEQEKQELIQQIRRLEAENSAKDEKLRQQETAKPTEEKKIKSKVSTKLFWDTREFNTFGIYTSTTGLPFGFTFWGFTDLHGNQHEIDDSFDFNRFFMEYRFSRALDPDWVFGIEGLGTQIEYNDSNGTGNQLARFGLTYKHNIPSINDKKGWLMWRGFPYESDGSGQQVSWIYYIPLHERVWISGFADLNIVEEAKDQWVIEPQLNVKLTDRTNFLVEYRYNGFEDDNSSLDGEGVAIGMDIKL